MTVTWHVDNLKISHMDRNKITKCIEHLKKIYGNRMTIHCGKVHDYLGMDLDLSSAKVLKIGMIKYVKKIIDETNQRLLRLLQSIYLLLATITRTSSYLRNKHWLFIILLPNFLFLRARARPDTRTAVSFLCSRTRSPDEDDWGKLKRVLKYLYGTKHM